MSENTQPITTYPECIQSIASIWISKQEQKKKEYSLEIRGLARHRVAFKQRCRKQGIPVPARVKFSPIRNSLQRKILERSVTIKLGVRPTRLE